VKQQNDNTCKKMFVAQFKTAAYMCINNRPIRPMCCHCDVVCLQSYNRSVFELKDDTLGRAWWTRQSTLVTILEMAVIRWWLQLPESTPCICVNGFIALHMVRYAQHQVWWSSFVLFCYTFILRAEWQKD